MALLTARRRGIHLPWRLLLRISALAAGVAGAAVFVIAPLTGHFSGEFEDFGAYLGAARAAAAHADIYAAFVSRQQNVALSGFDYPPIVAAALLPLAWMSSGGAATLWLLVDVAATIAGCFIVAMSVLPRRWPRIELAVIASLLFGAATYNLWHGQMNPAIFLLLALALRSWLRGDELRCGVFIGVAAAIKLAPVVLVLLLLRRRWWRGAAVAAGTVAMLTVAGMAAFGVHTTVEYVRDVLPVLSRDDGWLYNQSWDGVVNRLAGHSVLVFQPDVTAIRAIVLGLAAASVAAAAWTVRPGMRAGGAVRAGQFAAGVAAMLLAGSLTWYAHDVHLLIVFAAAAVLVARRHHGHRLLGAALAATLLACAVEAPLLIGAASMNTIVSLSHTAWWPLVLLLTSLPALTTAALLAALVRSSRAGDLVMVDAESHRHEVHGDAGRAERLRPRVRGTAAAMPVHPVRGTR